MTLYHGEVPTHGTQALITGGLLLLFMNGVLMLLLLGYAYAKSVLKFFFHYQHQVFTECYKVMIA